MSNAETKYSKGEVVLFTNGSYSDYSVEGLANVLRDCDFAELYPLYVKDFHALDATIKNLPFSERGTQLDAAGLSSFIAWLERKGYVAEITQRELNTDDIWDSKL